MKRNRKAAPLLAAVLIPAAVWSQTDRTASRDELDRSRTDALSARISQHVNRVVPRKTAGFPPERKWMIQYPKTGEYPAFHVVKQDSIHRICVPHGFSRWAFHPDSVLLFFNTLLSARTGNENRTDETWIAAGLVQDVYETGALHGAAGYGNHPFARAMLAHGFHPSAESILESEPGDFSEGIQAAVKMDWCSILLGICTRKNGASLLEKYLLSGKGESRSRRFERTVFRPPEDSGKKIFSAKNARSLNDWFRQEASKTVLGRGIPAAVPWIEETFSGIMEKAVPMAEKFSAERKKDEKRTPTGEETFLFAEAEFELNRLAAVSPEAPALKLLRCAEAIGKIRKGAADGDPAARLKEQRNAVYAALSERADLELALKRAERRLVPPGVRFALTLQAIKRKHEDFPVLKRAEELLDRFEKDGY